MAKPIALVAPYESTNYGTMLQAFALAYKINELGYSCEYINFTPQCRRTIVQRIINYAKRKLGIKKSLPTRLVYEGIDDYSYIYSDLFSPLRLSSKHFSDVMIPHSEICYSPKTIKKCLNKYDRFIVGSDQTWSMERYIGMNGFYMLPFIKKSTKCFAYAPSLGTTKISDAYAHILYSQLGKFEFISCREKLNCKTLSHLLNRNVHYVLDPTMLMTGDEWRNIADRLQLPNKYILAYILGERDDIRKFAEKIGKQLGLPVLYVCTRPKYVNMLHTLPMNLTPEQWVWAIDNAECVITDSFHGSVFSINLSTNFYAFSKRDNTSSTFNDNDRIIDLLTSLGMENRFVSFDSDSIRYSSINYETVAPILYSYRQKSIHYLQTILL